MSFELIYVFVILIVIGFIVFIYNKFVKLRNMVEEAFSIMDVYLKKRWDLIPNLIEVVKSYAKHEKDVFEKVTELRSISYKQIPNKQKLNINKIMQEEISKIFGVVENYPILKADRNFLELNEQLVKIEEEIENSRKYYNAVVCEYNTNVECFPLNIFAYIFNFKKKKMFKINERERDSIKVNM